VVNSNRLIAPSAHTDHLRFNRKANIKRKITAIADVMKPVAADFMKSTDIVRIPEDRASQLDPIASR
jgi:hypothetical protein